LPNTQLQRGDIVTLVGRTSDTGAAAKLFGVGENHGIVLLNGGGFEAPEWSLRVSLANLPDEAYEDIGRGVRAIARGYRDAFEASKRGDQSKRAGAP
jgi:hypothetical protein